MTDLLSRPGSSAQDGTVPDRRLVLVAALAGVAAPLVLVFLLWALGLVAWFAADGGSHGSTLSVLRLAGDAWLLAHGAHLRLPGPDAAVVTASPLGLTLVCGYVAVRLARWAAVLALGGGVADVARATAAFAGSYAGTGLALALLSRGDAGEPGLVTTATGCLLVGGLAGGLGLILGTESVAQLRARVPMPARSVLLAGLAATVLLAAAGLALTAVSLALHGPAAVRIVERLDLDASGVLFSLLLTGALAPNAALLVTSYLAGPGFALGAGTVVSTSEVSVGPLPTVPLLAAVPADGVPPGWLAVLLAVPPVLACVAVAWAARVVPTRSWRSGLLRGVGGGAAGAVLLTAATWWAGGSIGPGRMSTLGAPLLDMLTWNLLGLGLGGLVGGLGGTWWARRLDLPEAVSQPRPPRAERPISLYPQRLAPVVEQSASRRRPDARRASPGEHAGDPVAELAEEHTVVVPRPGDDR